MIKLDFKGVNILPPGGTPIFLLGPNGRRLKKNCPCMKCQQWRADREIRRMHKNMAEAFVKATSQTIEFRTPIIDSEASGALQASLIIGSKR